MPKKTYKFNFTNHVRERYAERFLGVTQKEAKRYVKDHCVYIDRILSQRLSMSTNEKSFLNNTSFMMHLYEKYGTENRIEFLVHDDVVFVNVLDNGRNVITTCYEAKDALVAQMVSRIKYKKK